ncbi:MAG: 3'-5' exonuclease, partial [Kiritimatiellia bacterium]|nr:3'-5' exonuclease [Kiritimatiellia bacterium]
FTRKAAGEILSRILTRLAAAAASPAGFAELTERLTEAHLPAFADRPAVQAALRSLVQSLPLLRIGTLDSFFLHILRPFRFEAGIAAELAIAPPLENPEDNLILQGLLERTALAPDEQRELLETFKQATFGEEKKSVYGSIARLVQNQYELARRAPDPEAWGTPARIWADPAPLLTPPAPPDWAAVFAALDVQAETLQKSGESKAWEKFTAILREVSDDGTYDFGSVLHRRLYTAFTAPDGERTDIPFGRSAITLLPETQEALAPVFAYIRFLVLNRQIIRTRGLYHLLAAYGREHRRHMTRSGQLGFNDLAQLLAPGDGQIPPCRRALMDGRLDAHFRHWLLDEFQDTSLIQWAVIENLLDEVLQNPDADRTLFYVGDTKQAIYEWRSGDPRLFQRILDKYNRPSHTAIERAAPLVQSWRSSPYVLEAVNTVFGDLPDVLPSSLSALADDWNQIVGCWKADWTKPHEAADKIKDLSGHAALYLLPQSEKDAPPPSPFSRAVDLVEQLQHDIPEFERYSVALLTRSNAEGLAVLDALAAKNIRAVWAGNSPLLDNALIPALLSLARLIEHPGDTLARRHIAMSPLAASPIALTPAALAAQGRLIREQGYAGFVAQLAATLDLSEAPLELARLRTLIAIAAEFDRQPDTTALQFCAHVQAQDIAAEDTGSNIQILTMHKAKGLEYDMVILPLMERNGILSHGKGPLLIHEQDSHEPIPPVDWILAAPEQDIISTEPPLAAQLAANRRSKALEELRLLYVAMTRARSALVLITTAPGEKSRTLRLGNILQQTLAPDATPDADAPAWETGDSAWWKQAARAPTSSPPPAAPLALADLPAAPTARPPAARMASQDHVGGDANAGWPFRPEGSLARDFGTRVHDLFEQIEWLAPGDIPAFPDADADAAQLVRTFLDLPANHAFLEKPAGTIDLLREQAFEAVLDGRWLSGKIDRLHLERNPAGKPVRAHIFDYKTDQTPDVNRHRPQMEDYRQAVARLFALPPEHITATLLFVRTGDARSV